MGKHLFRKEALKTLQTPEQLHKTLVLTGPVNWMVIAALVILALSLGAWGILGSITTGVPGQGIILLPGGISRVVATEGGQVQDIAQGSGDRIEEGAVLLSIVNAEGEESTVSSPHRGRLLEVFVHAGEMVVPGQKLFTMEVYREGEEELKAFLFVSAEAGQSLRPGMKAHISPLTVRKEEHGYIVGEVEYVADFPSSLEGVQRVLANEDLARRMVGEIIPIQVRIKLLSHDTPSGYLWTSGQGPEQPVSSGTLCQGKIIIREERPLALVFPGLRVW